MIGFSVRVRARVRVRVRVLPCSADCVVSSSLSDPGARLRFRMHVRGQTTIVRGHTTPARLSKAVRPEYLSSVSSVSS